MKTEDTNKDAARDAGQKGNRITALQVANILASTDGVNASSLALPAPSSGEHRRDNWSWWVARWDGLGGFIGKAVSGGEFVAYPMVVSGADVTLVLFSWTSGGFDGSALVDGHPEDVSDAAEMWLGSTFIDEHDQSHPIHELLNARA